MLSLTADSEAVAVGASPSAPWSLLSRAFQSCTHDPSQALAGRSRSGRQVLHTHAHTECRAYPLLIAVG